MTRTEKMIPKMRFKQFMNSDDWEQRELGEFGYFYYGKSAPKWSVTEDAETPCVRYGELYSRYNEKIDMIHSYTNIPRDNLKFSTGKEVLVPRVGEDPLDFANCTWLSVPNVAIGEMISVYNTDQNPLFTAYMFNGKLKYEFAKRVEGGNVSNLYYAYLEDILISYPTIEEQKKIADLFENLENLITLHQRKLEKVQAMKKAYLTEMFPQNGESVPKRRFTGYDDDWEQCKWSETVDISTNMVNPKSGLFDELPHVAPGNIESFTGMLYNNVKLVKEENLISGKFHFNKNDIIYGKINPQLAKYYYADSEGLTSADAYVLNAKNGFDQEFLFSLIHTNDFYKYTVSVSKRSGMPKINRDGLNAYEFMAPKEDEQKKIGDFFLRLDNFITLHQHKLEKLKNLKKSYLNELFI